MDPIEEFARAASGVLLVIGWILVSAFGLVLYFGLRGLPKEVLGARLFLNLDKVGRGFLLLSIGFIVVLLAAVPSRFAVPGTGYLVLAGSAVWFATTAASIFYLFKSLYVPRSVRKKFGAPA